jgi:hypothetical protein
MGTPLAAAATLTLPADAGGLPGSTWILSLTVHDAAGMLGTDIVVTYDPEVVTATDVSKTPLSLPHVLTYNLSPAGLIRISLYGSDALSGSGSLLTITFTAIGPEGSHSILDIDSADLNEGGIPVSLVDGRFCIAGTGEEVQDLTVDLPPPSTTAVFSWSAHAHAGSYNLYRGSRPDLTDLGCHVSGITGTSAPDDGAIPLPGNLFVYLVTGSGCTGETSPGRDSTGTERVILAPCP